MRSIEDKNCLNHESVQENPGGGAIGFDFHRGNGSMSSDFHKANGANRTPHHRTALGKPTPSKWDDAQKWLVNLSRGGERHHSKNEPRNSNADDRRLIVPVPKKEYSSSEDEEGNHGCVIPYGVELETKTVDFCDNSMWRVNNEAYGIPNPNSNSSGVRSICVRDMGTEMTPIASQEPSRTATPVRATTPAARSPIASGSSTPVRFPNGTHNVESCQMAENNRMGGSTTRFGRETEESVVDNVPENTNLDQPAKLNPLETRAMAWDEAERAKYMARYKSEEVKIQAWENHQKRKAEMEMKRTEAKAERLKSRAQEKYTNKLASTRRIAEEKRAKAEATLNEKAVRTSERADYIRRTGHLPSSFSIKLPSCCW